MTDLVLPSLAAYDVDVPPATAPVQIYKNISLPGHEHVLRYHSFSPNLLSKLNMKTTLVVQISLSYSD